MRQSIILAAGNGQRFATQGQFVPKPLIQINGRPLIAHALHQACAAGCDEAVVVVGYHADEIVDHLLRTSVPINIRFAYNEQTNLPNGVSLLRAAEFADDRFFLQMVDHVFTRPVLRDFPMTSTASLHLLVDRTPVHMDEEDATKVELIGDRITAIGKELVTWDAIDAGYFLLDRRIFDALRSVEGGAPSVSDGMRVLISRGALTAVPLTGVAWVDVDTPHDRDVAESLLGNATPVCS